MTNVLILYMSRGGHTARIARRLCESIDAAGGHAVMMDLVEAGHEGVDWNRYDVVVLGAPVLYGKYDRSVLDFVAQHRTQLEARPNSFFNVSVVARVRRNRPLPVTATCRSSCSSRPGSRAT